MFAVKPGLLDPVQCTRHLFKLATNAQAISEDSCRDGKLFWHTIVGMGVDGRVLRLATDSDTQ